MDVNDGRRRNEVNVESTNGSNANANSITDGRDDDAVVTTMTINCRIAGTRVGVFMKLVLLQTCQQLGRKLLAKKIQFRATLKDIPLE
jgi:hypothetical protein